MSLLNIKQTRLWIQSHWSLIRKVGTAAFVVLLLVLLVVVAKGIEWAEVWSAILRYRAATLWTAGLIAASSYLIYSTFDLLGKWYVGHDLAWWKSMLVGFVCYAFTLSIGAPVGGVGLRLRLYTKMGLRQGEALRIMALSLTTNWIGYLLLAGAIFVSGEVRLPRNWELGNGALQLIGAGMLGLGLFYLCMCAFSRTRAWTIRGHEIELPSIGLAALQISLAVLNWSLIAAIIYSLLPEKIGYIQVLGISLISAVAGALAHIPGGIGVTESIFVAFLSAAMPRFEILGAMFVYRALYYLGPLLIASLCYLALETKLATASETEL